MASTVLVTPALTTRERCLQLAYAAKKVAEELAMFQKLDHLSEEFRVLVAKFFISAVAILKEEDRVVCNIDLALAIALIQLHCPSVFPTPPAIERRLELYRDFFQEKIPRLGRDELRELIALLNGVDIMASAVVTQGRPSHSSLSS